MIWSPRARPPLPPFKDDVEADVRTGHVLARLEVITERFETIADRIERRMQITEEHPDA